MKLKLLKSVLPLGGILNVHYRLLFTQHDHIPVPSIHSAAKGAFPYKSNLSHSGWLRRWIDSKFHPTALLCSLSLSSSFFYHRTRLAFCRDITIFLTAMPLATSHCKFIYTLLLKTLAVLFQCLEVRIYYLI
jgi:hypothetical protein